MLLSLGQHVLNGVVHGSILGLAALGLTLAFAIARFAHVAHGDYLTLGAYLALAVHGGLGWPLAPAAVAAAAATVAIGLVAHRALFQPLARKDPVARVIASIGVALVLRHGVMAVWGTQQQAYRIPIRRAFVVAGLRIAPTDLAVLTVAVALTATLHAALRWTRVGQEMRAVADDPDLARVSGVSPARVTAWMWSWSLALAAVAGVLLGASTVITPYMGWDLLLGAFAAAILGGVGSPVGAVLGGFLIGVSEDLATLVVAPTYRSAVAFLVMAAVLLTRPTGILGRPRLLR